MLHHYAQKLLDTCRAHLFTYLDLGLPTKSNSPAEMIAWLIKRFHCPRGRVTRSVICSRNWAALFRRHYNRKRTDRTPKSTSPPSSFALSADLVCRPTWELLVLQTQLNRAHFDGPVLVER
jgi:hypothetical protein